MSITKPYTFTAGTKARANEVNADFDTLYSQVNINIADIAQNKLDIEDLESTKAEINGNATQRFSVADAVNSSDAVNKQTLKKAINNSIDFIYGYTITKNSNSPTNTILVSAGSCYDSTKNVVLASTVSRSKKNSSQGANTTYYVYVIGDDSGNQIDILISTLSVTPNLPSGYTKFRRIGSYTTNSSSSINIIKSNGYSSSTPSAKAVIVDSYVSGKNGYIIYSNGYCEQWGYANTPQNTATTVTLLKTYSNTNYNVLVSPKYVFTTGDWDIGMKGAYPESGNTIIIRSARDSNDTVYAYWRTFGFLASGQY